MPDDELAIDDAVVAEGRRRPIGSASCSTRCSRTSKRATGRSKPSIRVRSSTELELKVKPAMKALYTAIEGRESGPAAVRLDRVARTGVDGARGFDAPPVPGLHEARPQDRGEGRARDLRHRRSCISRSSSCRSGMAARRDDARKSDAIIVLGAAQFDGRPSKILAARLDHAHRPVPARHRTLHRRDRWQSARRSVHRGAGRRGIPASSTAFPKARSNARSRVARRGSRSRPRRGS